MTIRIGIIYAHRRNGVDLINRTIGSMLAEQLDLCTADQIGLFVDEVDAPKLEKPVNVFVRDAQGLATLRSGRYHGAFNLARAMAWCAQADVAVLSEDDYLMGSGWLRRGLELLRVAGEENYVCLSHLWATMDMHDETELQCDGIRLHKFGRKLPTPNGFSPVLMSGPTARRIGAAIDLKFGRVEPDMALLYGGRAAGVEGYVSDPCLAMHMNIESNYDTKRPHYNGETKRFLPI